MPPNFRSSPGNALLNHIEKSLRAHLAGARQKRKVGRLSAGVPGRDRPSVGPRQIRLWQGDHVTLKQLAEDFARYLYLPMLACPDVLVAAIRAKL
jgi:hypothetical protein